MLSELNKKYLSLRLATRLVISALGIALFFICTQKYQIFPGAYYNAPKVEIRGVDMSKNHFEEFGVLTADGETLTVWRLEPDAKNGQIAIIFYGNASNLGNNFGYQYWLSELGFITYGFDYRGYGKSTGSPSEIGLYVDAETVSRYIAKREGINPNEATILGISIGSGPAAYLASITDPKTLILLSPFTSLKEIVNKMPLYKFLSPFLLYEFPVKSYVSMLDRTCLVVAHGESDTVIPIDLGREVYKSFRGKKGKLIEISSAAHNDVHMIGRNEIEQALEDCVKNSS